MSGNLLLTASILNITQAITLVKNWFTSAEITMQTKTTAFSKLSRAESCQQLMKITWFSDLQTLFMLHNCTEFSQGIQDQMQKQTHFLAENKTLQLVTETARRN